MRPMSSEVLGGRPRKAPGPESSTTPDEREQPSSHTMTYFLADEATVTAATSGNSSAAGKDFGVRSLEASVEDSDLRWSSRKGSAAPSKHDVKAVSSEEEDDDEDEDEAEDEDHDHDHDHDVDDKKVDENEPHEEDEDHDDLQSITSLQSSILPDCLSSSPQPLLSEPLTPLLGPASDIPDTPRSVPNLYERKEEGSKRAEKSADTLRREREERSDAAMAASMSMSMPQLIMPEITMPSRRPFTTKGKQIGRLKIMIAGDSGIGKTSLIKSIVQTCEDIVHVDPLSLQSGSPFKYGSSSFSNMRRTDDSTKQITEVYASTRPYPHWWSEIDENRVLRRRKSRAGVEEQVIERNLCFVDTPGYGSGTSFLECIEPVVKYVEGQFERTQSIVNSGEGDFVSLLSGSGTSQVDIVFYVILHRLKPVDVEFIRRLSPFTSVLPVIAKADTLTPQQVTNLKLSVLNDLRAAGIRPFLFGNTPSEIIRRHNNNTLPDDSPPYPPFAVSSVVASDAENMEASVLMSPEYVPPLVDTELKELVGNVFEPDNIAWLRHAAAKKYMQWKSTVSSTALAPRPATPIQRRGSPSASGLLNSSLIHMPAGGAPDSFALAKVADHTQREERLAKVRLSRWAHDLQRSLQAERERYERLARGERALWLTERLGETISEGQLVPISSLPLSARAAVAGHTRCGDGIDTRDPFGILKLNEVLCRRISLMVKIAGLGGVIGVVGVWMLNRWGVTGSFLPQVQGES